MPRSRVTQLLVLCGVLGSTLFLAVILLEGALRPGYDPVRQLSSELSLGERGWIQIANFVVTALLMIAFAAGLRRALRPGRGATLVPLLVGVYALGLLGAGVFLGDASTGHPPGTGLRTSWHGLLHNVFAAMAFQSLALVCLMLAWRELTRRLWAAYSALTCLALVSMQPLLNALTDGADRGLVQKLAIAVGWCWIAALGLRLLRRQSTDQSKPLAGSARSGAVPAEGVGG